MAVSIVMPKVSDTMTEGKVVKWLTSLGEAVSLGTPVVEIETDKVNMEVEATGEGIIGKILAVEGETVPVGQVLAVVTNLGEEISAPEPGSSVQPYTHERGHTGQAMTPGDPSVLATLPSTSTTIHQPGVSPILEKFDVAPRNAGHRRISPLAKRIARDKGIDVSWLTGSGPGGRIVARDLEYPSVPLSGASQMQVSASATPQLSLGVLERVSSGPNADFRDEPISPMRKAIVARVAQSLTVPHFYLTIDVSMLRAKQLRESAELLESDIKLTYNDIITKACSNALRLHPEMNASFLGDRIRFHNRIHVGIAVSADDGGLVVAIVRDCGRKSLQQISRETKHLVGNARQRRLAPEEFSGATFTVSNLGMLGVEEFSALISPPGGAILAVGAIEERPVVNNGQIKAGLRCRMTLACDHRVVDGWIAAKFLQTLRTTLEQGEVHC